jgi:hypothetical protein
MWLGSARHVMWLRRNRATICSRSVVVLFAWLVSCAIALSNAASEFCLSIRHRLRAIEALRDEYPRISTALMLAASAGLWVASNARRMGQRWGAGRSGSSFRRFVVYRRLMAATAALLILATVPVILAAVLVTPGRGEPRRLSTPLTRFSADTPVVPSQSNRVTESSDPIALLLDRVSSSEIAPEPWSEAAAEAPSPQPAGDEGPAGDSHAATPRHDLRRAAPPIIVGVWAPETGSCSVRHAREGVLPAVISERGARAGDTSCVFKEQRWTERDWQILANCTNGHERWTSNVRLTVKGDRLVWTSKRGTQTYTRCRSNI